VNYKNKDNKMIYLCGDTHGTMDITKLNSENFSKNKNMTKNDYVIILGDFGLLWKNVPDKTEKKLIKWYNEKPFSTLFLSGNHENYTRINNLPDIQMFDNVVGKVSDSIFYLKTGHVYNIENKSFFNLWWR
jgi:predicted phosphodiesterase